MASVIVRTRLDSALSSALLDFATDWQQPVSAVLRDAVRYILTHPDVYAEILSERLVEIQHTNTPAQDEAGRAYLQSLSGYDLAAVLSEFPDDTDTEEGYK